MLLGGRPQGGHEFFFEKAVCGFSAYLFPRCCISRNVSARPGGGGPQFFFPCFFPNT